MVCTMTTKPAETKPVLTTEELSSLLGEGIHTGLRKGTEAAGSHKVWKAIAADDSGWDDAIAFCMYGMKTMYPDGFTWSP